MNTSGAKELKPGETAQGVIPAVELDLDNMTKSEVKLLPWQKAARIGEDKRPNARVFVQNTEVPRSVLDDMTAGLPAPVRRSASQRYEVLVKRLMDMSRAFQTPAGVMWPDSLQRILDASGSKNRDATAQVYTLARHFIVKAENKQRETDARMVTRGWHGHFD